VSIIERELEKDGYAAPDLAQAAKLQAIPVANSPPDRYLEHLDRS
jgi:hypothetical protein